MLTLLTVSEQQRHSMLSLQCILGKMNFQRIAAVLASRTPRKKKCLSGASPPPGRTAHFKQAELNQVSLERVLVLHLILISEMLLLFELLELMRFHLHEPQTH